MKEGEYLLTALQLVFTVIPLVSTLTFLPSLFTALSFGERLLSLLGILSLLATAYMMRLAPLHPDRKGKKPLSPQTERLEMIHSSLLPVNGAVGVLLTLIYLLFLRGNSSFIISPVLYLIPGGKSLGFHVFNIASLCRKKLVL